MLSIDSLNIQFITDADGEKRAVVLPIDQFNQLLEDLDDLAVIAERRDEPTIPQHKVYEILKANGILSD